MKPILPLGVLGIRRLYSQTMTNNSSIEVHRITVANSDIFALIARAIKAGIAAISRSGKPALPIPLNFQEFYNIRQVRKHNKYILTESCNFYNTDTNVRIFVDSCNQYREVGMFA